MTIQALVRNSHTVAFTFTGKPSREVLQKLKNAGYRYDKGNWYLTQSSGKLLDENDIDAHIAA